MMEVCENMAVCEFGGAVPVRQGHNLKDILATSTQATPIIINNPQNGHGQHHIFHCIKLIQTLFLLKNVN